MPLLAAGAIATVDWPDDAVRTAVLVAPSGMIWARAAAGNPMPAMDASSRAGRQLRMSRGAAVEGSKSLGKALERDRHGGGLRFRGPQLEAGASALHERLQNRPGNWKAGMTAGGVAGLEQDLVWACAVDRQLQSRSKVSSE